MPYPRVESEMFRGYRPIGESVRSLVTCHTVQIGTLRSSFHAACPVLASMEAKELHKNHLDFPDQYLYVTDKKV